MARRKGRHSLKKILQSYSKEVQNAAMESMNKAVEGLAEDIKSDMDAAGVKEDTGNLRGSIKAFLASEKKLESGVKSEVYKKPLPKNPGSRNPNMVYPSKGVPYGRLIEYSPRINKPFFYTSFYEKRGKIVDDIFEAIKKAGSK